MRHTGNKRVDSWCQSDQDTKTLGGAVAQSLASSVSQTTGESALELGQEGLDSQWNLLQQLVKSVEDSA